MYITLFFSRGVLPLSYESYVSIVELELIVESL